MSENDPVAMWASRQKRRRQTSKRKPGPMPFEPTTDDRRRVELGIAGGFSAAKMAQMFDMPQSSFKRAFSTEIAIGRTKVAIAMMECLHKAATVGKNVAAAKALLGFVERTAKPATALPETGRWDHILPRNRRNLGDSENLVN